MDLYIVPNPGKRSDVEARERKRIEIRTEKKIEEFRRVEEELEK